jgi:hypothetical protein
LPATAQGKAANRIIFDHQATRLSSKSVIEINSFYLNNC